MCVHVHCQGRDLRERPAACFTNIQLLPRMRADVRRQVAVCRERLAARLADMQLLP